MPIEIVIEMPTCEGCCGPSCGGVQCQVRSGSGPATICGYSEFTLPSTPPKKYLLKTYSGGYSTTYYVGLACTMPIAGCDRGVYTGENTYDPSDCTLDEAATQSFETTGCIGACTPLGPPSISTAPANFGTGSSGAFAVVVTQTRQELNSSGVCGSVFVCGSSSNMAVANGVMELTNEDTIYDAIDRVGYDAYGPLGDCDTDTYSFITLRGAGEFTSSFQQAQAQTCCTGLVIGAAYEATMITEMRKTGSSDPWVTGPSVTHGFTASSTTECTALEIPLVDQKEVRVGSIGVHKI